MSKNSTIISKNFVIDVAKYFMAFLETDFKKRAQPKRNLTNRVNKGLTTGLHLDKYPVLYKELYKNLINGFQKETIKVDSGKHVVKISDRLISLLDQRIEQISEDEIKEVVSEITKEVNQLRLDNQKDYDNYFETSIEVTKLKLSSLIVSKLLNDIVQSLEASGWNSESGLFQLETDATAKIYSLAEDTLANVLEDFFITPQDSKALRGSLESIFDVDNVKSALKDFFREFGAKDAYAEILQLSRNKDMLDKTELYVYFGEIGVNNYSFPLFYTPISVEHAESSVSITFDNRIFVNIKAIEFAVQQNNISTSNSESIAGNFERILYFEDKKDLLPTLQKIFDTCQEVLGLTRKVDLKDSNNQISNNMVSRLSNRLQLFLFDKSDESLINDYEEIIDDQGDLTEAFAELIDTFVTENPENFIEDVAQEWEEKTIQDKLIVDSPIALNEEQKQVLLALQKKDCKVAILEGPPGTGKSHTITAIVCKALLEGQSVLVLSDKEEALDVVQDKITDTLSEIRHDKNFQNPILRLGKSSKGLAKVIEGQVLERVREHMRAYRSKEASFTEAEVEAKKNAKEVLETIIGVGGKLNLQDIKQVLLNEQKYKDIDWVDEIDEETSNSIVNLHSSLLSFTASNVLYLLPFVNSQSLGKISVVINALEVYMSSRSAVHNEVAPFIKGIKTISQNERAVLHDELDLIKENTQEYLGYLKDSGYSPVFDVSKETTVNEFYKLKTEFNLIREAANSVKLFSPNINDFSDLVKQSLEHDLDLNQISAPFTEFVTKLQALKKPLIGFSGKKSSIEQLTRELKSVLPYFNINSPEKHITLLVGFADILNFLSGKLSQQGLDSKQWKSVLEQLRLNENTLDNINQILENIGSLSKFEFVSHYKLSQLEELVSAIQATEDAKKLKDVLSANDQLLQIIELEQSDVLGNPKDSLSKFNKLYQDNEELSTLLSHRKVIENFISEYEDIAENLNLRSGSENFDSVDEKFINMSKDTLEDYLNSKILHSRLADRFDAIANDSFADSSDSLFLLNAAKMANILDTRIISYVDKHAADIRTLKSMLKSKQKFPKGLFGDLKQAFPCILAGIRDYATYIPLEKDLFDLVIIDEASQVSIAQALPALIRGKKILVLGDEKQFSNVKAGNASVLTNNKYRNSILNSLRAAIDGQPSDMNSMYTSRVQDNFNVKKSILDFCRFITNYQTMLKKHFRCYPEVIGYSNKYFYDGNLQCMKARALPISEVIKFSRVDTTGIQEQYKLTNSVEADFVLEHLKALKEKNYDGTLGVITPHREQATYINNLLRESEINDWLQEHSLKVMTFDTCQGEERDYILYSMVERPNTSTHRFIFPVSMEDSKNAGKEFGTREQRLNVGFSRAKETIHFILSKPVEEYWGEVKTALLHYNQVLNDTNHIIGGTDDKSPMEPVVQNYFYQTEFYEKHKDQIELVPQFPLGEYLRSLDRNYSHPKYKVDFLLTFGKQKIIIEYDGFKEHFIDRNDVNVSNHESYLKEEDVYRQKVLEGYGYKFLRLNKFNLGKEPVKHLDGLLADVVKKKNIRKELLTVS